MGDGIEAGKNFRIRTFCAKVFSVSPRLVVSTGSSNPFTDVIVPTTLKQCTVQQNDQMTHIQGWVTWEGQDESITGANPHFPEKIDMRVASRPRIIMSRVSPGKTTASVNATQSPPAMDGTIADSVIDTNIVASRAQAIIQYMGVMLEPLTSLVQGRLLPGTTTFNNSSAPGTQTRDFYSTSEIWIAKFGEIDAGANGVLLTHLASGDLAVAGGFFFSAIYPAQGLTIGV